MASIKTYLQLLRPANVVTSVADVVAGIAISGYFTQAVDFAFTPVLLLCLSTACLYAGGIVFNDVFDFELDKTERPERALPSGKVLLAQAILFGSLLLISGVLLATAASLLSGLLALAIACCALLYNKVGKHFRWLGPLNMGLCRGLNLLLGISIVPLVLNDWYLVAIVPVVYIYAITMISRGEVGGSGRKPLYAAMLLYLAVIATIAILAFGSKQFPVTIALLIAFGFFIFKPLLLAIQIPIGKNIGRAVKSGVIALILMDAAWAVAFDAVYAAVFICLLLPVSLWLSKYFAVT
jgi:hypothetical protein